MRRYFVSCLTAVALVAAAGPVSSADDPGPALLISDAWVRAMPPGQRMTAAYLSVDNQGSETVVIRGVSSGVGDASLHETVVEDGRSRMRGVDSLPVAPGEHVAMEPGGLHVMLMGLESTPREGESVTVCLMVDESQVCADAPVSRDGAPAGHHAHHGGSR